MDAILNIEQEELLKRTRDTLGQLRDLLADTAASNEDRPSRFHLPANRNSQEDFYYPYARRK